MDNSVQIAMVDEAGDLFYPDDDEDRRWFADVQGARPLTPDEKERLRAQLRGGGPYARWAT